MQGINNYLANVTQDQLIDVAIAILIIVLFRIASSYLSYFVIKMFKIKEKNKERIKSNPFYTPLKAFIRLLGVFLAILYLQQPLSISDDIMNIIIKAFKIIATIIFAKGLAQSLTLDAKFVKVIREKSDKDLDDGAIQMILKIIRAVVYVSAGFIVITELGYNLNGLVAGLGVTGVIVTLAAQDTAKNLFGGAVIFLDKPFAIGDWIEVCNYEGIVEELTFRSTRIRTFENCVVNIPNSKVSDSSIINWSKMEKRRYKIELCLELDTPLEKVNSLIERIQNMLLKHDKILDDSIIVKFDKITDNGIEILILTYTDSVDYESYLTEREIVNYKIMQLLKDEKIELAYNTQTIYTKQAK